MREFVIKDWKTLGPLSSEPELETVHPPKKGARPGSKEAAASKSLVSVEIDSGSGPQVVVERSTGNQRNVPPVPAEAPGKVKVTQSPRKAEEIPAPAAAAKPSTPKRRGQRSFIIALDGKFVGYFESDRDISSREAYLRIAQELAGADEQFEPGKLELYKPVLLRGARPSLGLNVVRGKIAGFSWQKGIVPAEKSAPK